MTLDSILLCVALVWCAANLGKVTKAAKDSGTPLVNRVKVCMKSSPIKRKERNTNGIVLAKTRQEEVIVGYTKKMGRNESAFVYLKELWNGASERL